jgi:hypothetical protein
MSMNRRMVGRNVAALVAIVCFGWATWAAHVSSMPEFQVYDGYWMILGAFLTTSVAAPLVWRWPRELSLVAITAAALLGIIAPLAISAARLGMPIRVRLLGSWVLGGADLVAPALVVGFMCLWFAVRQYQPRGTPMARGSDQ